jgi:hypothetical protein
MRRAFTRSFAGKLSSFIPSSSPIEKLISNKKTLQFLSKFSWIFMDFILKKIIENFVLFKDFFSTKEKIN